MEDTKPPDEDDIFYDASDEFPFYDCIDELPSPPQSTLSLSSPSPSTPSAVNLRRRRSISKPPSNSLNLHTELPNSELTGNDVDVVSSSVSEELHEERGSDDGELSWVVYIAALLIKAIEFQFNILISLITFPIWVLYYCIMIFVNPFYIIGMFRSYIFEMLMRLWNLVNDSVSPLLSDWIKDRKSWLDMVLRCGRGLFLSVWVCSVLVTLLVSAFVIGGLMMRYYVVEEPFRLKQGLNFDYTKCKPEAFVPILSCSAGSCGDGGGRVESGVRVLSPNKKVQATVTLVLPESDYNRKLGMFQVRIDYLSEHGKSLASLSHPCMLEFHSEPLRLLLTLFKIAPVVAGYISESQTLNLKFRGYTESFVPTACLKVTIEQRAEFQPAAGIPEIYDAFLHLESELPFLKRIMWYWRRTIFVWLSITLFLVELLFALVCCRPLIIPRARARGNSGRNETDTIHR